MATSPPVAKPSTISTFRLAERHEIPQIASFLARIFALPATSDSLLEPALTWKYWASREAAPTSRSYVLERDGRIVGHVGVCPLTVREGALSARGVHMVDWAADPAAPGAGVLLLQKLTRQFDFVFSIGGSEATREVLPRFGFRLHHTAFTLARPIRPVRLLIAEPRINSTLPLRLLRNVLWSRWPLVDRAPAWEAVAIPTAEVATTLPADLLGGTGNKGVERVRDQAYFTWLGSCPFAQFRTYGLRHAGRWEGYFCLRMSGGSSCVAEIRLAEETEERWRLAFRAVQAMAFRHPGTVELSCEVAGEMARDAAAAEGMHLRKTAPVVVFDKRSPVKLGADFRSQMLDDDRAFMTSPSALFLT
jgi:hypothetical protein